MKTLLSFTLLFISYTLSAQTINCQSFRVGDFQNIEDGVVKADIKRTEEFQFEEMGNIKVKLKVEWIDDCTYKLIFVGGNEAYWDLRGRDTPTIDLLVKITSTNEDYYTQESEIIGQEGFVYKSTIYKTELTN